MDHQTAEHSRSSEATSISTATATPMIDSFVVVVIREEDDGNSSATDLEKKVSSESNLTSDPCSISKNDVVVHELKESSSSSKTSSCVVIDILKPKEEYEKIVEYSGDERVCRICHLNCDQSSEMMTTRAGLIELGCGCKDELGIAHGHCAESWFKIKGNRQCEICGETVNNVMGVGDYRFMEEWKQLGGAEGGAGVGSTGGISEERGCCRRQPFCNFLMGCLVIAFVLPWFLKINMV